MSAVRARPAVRADGGGCPMAHANRCDDSFQAVPPLRDVGEVTEVLDDRLARGTSLNLGAFTGSRSALCVYASPRAPTLAAFDLGSGDVRWTSAPGDLKTPGKVFRSGALMAEVGDGGAPRRVVYAACETELAAYDERSGARLWRRRCDDVDPAGGEPIGPPIAVTYTDGGALAVATSHGWVVTLDPLSGDVLDGSRLVGRARMGPRAVPGVFATSKSPVVAGDRLYVSTEFAPDAGPPRLRARTPTHLLRIDLREGRVRPPDALGFDDDDDDRPGVHRVGFAGARGSPSAVRLSADEVLLFANALAAGPRDPRPVLAAVVDDGRAMRRRWETRFAPDEQIFAAPAYHAGTGTLLVATTRGLYAFRQAHALSGRILPPRRLGARDVVGPRFGTARAGSAFGSPFALAFDDDREELVAYTNVRIGPRGRYGFLAAFALPARGPLRPRPLWARPLSTTSSGRPAPGPGTLGQPALFRYRDADGDERTGMIVATARTGTFILR